MTSDYNIVDYAGLQVAFQPNLEGGGRYFGQDFVPLVRGIFGKVGRLFECCAGPGFIGFSLLAHGLCESLVLADINPAAIDAINETVQRNRLHDKVTFYLSDGLSRIPKTERWDLVVGNPPHYSSQLSSTPSLITDDNDWRFHRRFYQEVGAFLAPGGSILIQESSEGSVPKDFLPMLADGGLDHIRTLWYREGVAGPSIYYIWAQKCLSGLITYSHTSQVTVPLMDAPSSPITLSDMAFYSIRLANRTKRPLQVHLLDEVRCSQLWALERSIIAPEKDVELGPMSFRPGHYTFVECSSGAKLGALSSMPGPHTTTAASCEV
ncbi:MAG: methyltransferase [Actinomycetota bacterium]|nr:methyltransferase [Actinomycetota bacterium]